VTAPAGEAWDSNVLRRVVPRSAAAALIERRAAAGEPIAHPAPAWAEIVAGYEALVRRGRQSPSLGHAHGWLRAAVGAGDVEVLPFDELAARAAGIVRGGAGLRRPKSWDVDVTIAATCWANAYTLVTRNRSDFVEIGALLARLVGGEPLRLAAPS
jgi:predicted nucleic acid-binding protein